MAAHQWRRMCFQPKESKTVLRAQALTAFHSWMTSRITFRSICPSLGDAIITLKAVAENNIAISTLLRQNDII